MTVFVPLLVALGFGVTEGLGGRIAAFVIPLLFGGALTAALTGAGEEEDETPNITGPFLAGLVLPGAHAPPRMDARC